MSKKFTDVQAEQFKNDLDEVFEILNDATASIDGEDDVNVVMNQIHDAEDKFLKLVTQMDEIANA